VRFEEVWLRYHRRAPWVLRGVTAHLDAGEAAVVTGPNGAGKSTLLRLAAGLLRAGRGTVADRPRRIGFVPERFPADQPFTARAYLTGMAAIYGRRDAAADLAAWAERLNLTALLDTRLPELSKGSVQKVGLVQALLGRPELLVLDEPWQGLDAQTRTQVPLIVAEVLAGGGRVLVSDHLGQTRELPGIRRWELADGTLRDADATPTRCVVELAMEASDVPAAVATLRAAGHTFDVKIRAPGGPA
jgi:ABC-2 type transport system ATP-binding protein